MDHWPAAEGIVSTLTSEEALRGLCRKFGIPEEYKPACAGADGRACRTPPHLEGSICVYEDILAAGMRVPLHPFYCEVLRHCSLAPSQLDHNAWRHMAAFVVLCSDVGVKPRLHLFRFFFSVFRFMKCWHRIRPRPNSWRSRSWPIASRHLFNLGVANVPDAWRQKYFFLSSPTGNWQCPVKWGKLRQEPPCDEYLDQETKNDILKLLGAKNISVTSLLSNDKLAAALSVEAVRAVSPLAPVTSERESEASDQSLPTEISLISKDKLAAAETARASKRKSPASDQPSPPTMSLPTPSPVVSAARRDPPLSSDDHRGGHTYRDATAVWFKRLKDGLVEAMDVVQEENSLLHKALVEAKEAAKAEVTEAKESETAARAELAKVIEAAKAELAKVRKAAKAEVAEARKAEAAANAELAKVTKAAKAEIEKVTEEAKATVAEATMVAEAAKVEVANTKKAEMASKAEFTKFLKSQDAKLQEFKDCCQAKLQMFSTELMKTFDGALDTTTVTPTHSAYPKSE
ncbi:hypothetical protein ACP4OV_003988 [Aristida adscensionis]